MSARGIYQSVLLLLLIGLPGVLKAQQDPKFSQYMFNRLVINPAFAGTNDIISATLIHRHQWVGFSGEPITQTFSICGPISKLHGGVGLHVVNDQLGLDKSQGLLLSYSYRFNVGAGILGAGLQGGMFSKSLDGNQFKATDETYDDAIPYGLTSAIVPDFGLGVYYNTNKLYFGLSSSHINESKVNYDSISTYIQMKLKRHYYVTAGYAYEINPKFSIEPSVLIKSDATSTQVDVNSNFIYKLNNKRKVWAGASYSSGDVIRASSAIVLLVGMNITDYLRFGYSYDVTTTKINQFAPNTHEIMLGVDFKVTAPVKPIHIIRTPRFL